MGGRFVIGLGVGASVILAMVACASFDATSDAASTAEGGVLGSDGGGDGASDPDAAAHCTVVIDERFDTGYDTMPNLVATPTPSAACVVDGGALVASIPRPGSSSQAQVENDETPCGSERVYRLAFTVNGLVPAVAGDTVRVGCTLKLMDANNEQCNIFAVVGGPNLRADVDCSNSSSPSVVLEPLKGTEGALRVAIETTLDPTGGSFSVKYGIDGGPAAQEPGPFALKPVRWQLKCGIDEGKLVDTGDAGDAGDAGASAAAYTATVDDVRLELCGP